jgi:hypothetical protein
LGLRGADDNTSWLISLLIAKNQAKDIAISFLRRQEECFKANRREHKLMIYDYMARMTYLGHDTLASK